MTSEAHSGTHSVQMVVSSIFQREVYQDVTITGGNTYDFSVWIMASGLNANGATVELRWLDAGNVLRTDLVGSLGGSSNWTQVSDSGMVAPVGASQVKIYLIMGSESDGAGAAWFDDASLVEVALAPPTPTPTPLPTSTATATPTATPSPIPTPVVSVNSAVGSVGNTVAVDVLLGTVSNGISGFAFDLSVQSAGVATIQSVTLPDYGLQVVTGAPGAAVRVIVADTNEILQGQIASVVIVTIDLKLLATGTSQLSLTLSQLDSDLIGGDLLPVTLVVPGSITVN